jgi:hypothetical protein
MEDIINARSIAQAIHSTSFSHLGSWKKVKNIQQDDRVSLSMETGGKTGLLENYLVISGRARITEGGAPELLH